MKIYVPIPVEQELPPVQEITSRPIIVVCTDVHSKVSETQLREARYLSDYTDNSAPYFQVGNSRSYVLSGSDKVTHWLKEITLPDDFTIQNACVNPYRKEAENQHFYDEGFQDGAEYILKHIKGEL